MHTHASGRPAMDAPRAAEIGLRLVGTYFIVTGALTVANLFEAFDHPLRGTQIAGWVGSRLAIGGSGIGAGAFLIARSQRLAAAIPDLDAGARAGDRIGVIGFALLAAALAVRGLEGAANVTTLFVGLTRARDLAEVLVVATALITTGLVVWTSADRLASAAPGAALLLGITLLGAWLAVTGAADLAGWVVHDLIAEIGSRFDPALHQLPPILVRGGLGIALILSARARARRTDSAASA